MQTCIDLLPLARNPVVVNREGQTSAMAYNNAIGVGIHYASGQTVATGLGKIPQDKSLTFRGQNKPDTFTKGWGYNIASCPA